MEPQGMPDRWIDGRKWVRAWAAASARMEELRRQALAQLDIEQVMQGLRDAYECAIRTTPPRTSSGLIEQPRLFAKGRAEGNSSENGLTNRKDVV